MTAELETLRTESGEIVSFAAQGLRRDVWHQAGTYVGDAMTAEEAMRLSHMDRRIRIEPVDPGGAVWATAPLYKVILEGKVVETDGEIAAIPSKIVGVHGKGGAEAHNEFTIADRFQIAELATHVSEGAAVWSTAGMLRDGTQGFACMEAPATIIDPQGIRDIIRNYVVLSWSFDGSRKTLLKGSNIRVVCANTLAVSDKDKGAEIAGVKHTSATAEMRFRMVAGSWAKAQNEAKALKLMAENLLRVEGKKAGLNKLVEKFDPKPGVDAPKRTQTAWANRRETLDLVAAMPSNDVGDNAWAAWNTWVEMLDWFAPIRCANDKTEADCRIGNQFDGVHDKDKVAAANLLLAV